MARLPALQKSMLGIELCVSVAAVVLFGLAYPDRFRSRLWENGGVEGWNSNPNLRIYFYANYKEPPEIPLIWSQRLTDSNLALAILSLVVALARAATSPLGYLPRSASALYDVLLAALWTASLAGQVSSDESDPEHTSRYPWYLTRGCSVGWARDRGWCRAAQASLAVSLLAMGLYTGRLAVEALLVWGEKRGGWESMGDVKHPRGGEGGLGAGEERGRYEALSPVLAFFPEDGQ